MAQPEAGTQRIDKWLWHARVARTRTLAQGLIHDGHVRLNGTRVEAASRLVRAGDVLTIALYEDVRILKVCGFSAKRGGALQAQALFEDMSPPRPPRGERMESVAEGGRPTKRDRRRYERIRDREGA